MKEPVASDGGRLFFLAGRLFSNRLHKLLFCQRWLRFRTYLCSVINQVWSLSIGDKWQRTSEA